MFCLSADVKEDSNAATWCEECQAHASVRKDQSVCIETRAQREDSQTNCRGDCQQATSSGWRNERRPQTKNGETQNRQARTEALGDVT
jgi:hypothetical protein